MNSNLDNFPIVNGFKLITPSRDLNSQNHTDTLGESFSQRRFVGHSPTHWRGHSPRKALLDESARVDTLSAHGNTLSQNWGQNLTSEDIEEMRNLILSCYYFKDIDNFFMNEKNLNKYIDKDILKINKTLSHDC